MCLVVPDTELGRQNRSVPVHLRLRVLVKELELLTRLISGSGSAATLHLLAVLLRIFWTPVGKKREVGEVAD